MSARPQPPLFVECYGTRTPEPVRGVVDSKSSVSLEPGRWQCEISAPNGVRATVQMEAKDGRISGDEMARRLLKRAHVDDLWIEPKSARVTVSDDAVMLGAWSNGRQLDADQFHVVELDRDGRHRRIRVATERKGRIDHIQVAIEGGASIVMRYPDRGQLHFQVDSASETPIRAVADGLDPAISAYWGFTRHAVVRGAYELGRRLAERLEQSELSTDELVVLAHWLTTHAIDDFELSALTGSALGTAMQTPDVRIMRWILLARRGREANTATVLTEFVGLLGAIKKQLPLYTETLRLFTHHLTSAAAQLLEHSPEEHERAEESLRWIWSLASAMTWDTEYTGYRALTPGTPDPKALTVHISERAKKKSAGWRPLL